MSAKTSFLIILLFFFKQYVYAQYSDAEVFKQMNPSLRRNASVDSFKKLINSSKEDTEKVILQWKLSNIYMWSFPDSSLFYSLQSLQLSQKLNFKYGTIRVYHSMAQALAVQEDYPKALEIEFKALHLSEELKNPVQTSLSFFWIALIYLYSGDAQKALYYLDKLNPASEVFLKNQELIFTHFGWCYLELNKVDSALFYIQKSCDLEIKENNKWCGPFMWQARIYDKMGKYADALYYYRKGISIAVAKRDFLDAYNSMAYIFLKINLADSSIYYSKKTINEIQTGFHSETIRACKLLVEIYKSMHETDSAFKYQNLMLAANDSLLSLEKIKQAQNISFIDQLRQQEEVNTKQHLQNKIRTNTLITALSVFLLIGFGLWRNNRHKQKANTLLQQQKLKVESTLLELKTTQTQLIQSEKDKVSAEHEKELHELEAKALRAQMNPHFIFNCINSIKSLIQKNEQDKAINYLTTFSKLIRTIFQNSDKREITLFDEIETCRLYSQLESLRFGNKLNYKFNVNETLDIKSIMVPALIIQPFIENAIWHGIMPKEEGGAVTVTVDKSDNIIRCVIDDDGIGREISKQNKFLVQSSTHESKGERLTQARLDLNNLLNERNATVEIIDKKNDNGKATGTTVIIILQEY